MIKLFRKIRQQLLTENKFSKYLLYAIGEIVLVVIGILIALQINNANELRKERAKEKEILKQIRSDLKEDSKFLKNTKIIYQNRLSYFKKIDTTISCKKYDLSKGQDSSSILNYRNIFINPKPFLPVSGTYKSIIGDGNTNIIRNKELLKSIQNLYDVQFSSIESIYGTIKDYQMKLAWKRSYEYKFQPYKNLEEINDKQLLAELGYFFEIIHFYGDLIFSYNDKVDKLIEDINIQLLEYK